MKGSTIAAVTLILWVPIAISLFSIMNGRRAVRIVLLAGVMLLPEDQVLKLPVLPDLNKFTITSLCVLIGCLLFARGPLLRTPWNKSVKRLIFIFFVGTIGSVVLNRDPIPCGFAMCQQLYLRNILTFVLEDGLYMFVPFWVGFVFYRNEGNLREFLIDLTVAGLLYSIFVLIELRLSPQMHTWVYAYTQHTWTQVRRMGGWRPMVFMKHGLALSLFMATTAIAATSLAKARILWLRQRFFIPAIYLTTIALLCHSLGAIVYVIIITILIVFTSFRIQISTATFLCIVVILFPILRATDIFPTDTLIELSSKYSHDRAASLAYRFENEDMMIRKTMNRPFFGWGGFGRIRVYDQETGRDLVTPDGAWIIEFAGRGIVGFIPVFGLLILPVFIAYRMRKKIRDRSTQILIGGMSLIVAINTLDLLPNGMFHFLCYFFSGTLLGIVTNHRIAKNPLVKPVYKGH